MCQQAEVQLLQDPVGNLNMESLVNFPFEIEKILSRDMVSYRETCPHWIDYEILDALPDHLKERYIDRFKLPEICISPPNVTVKIKCPGESGYGFDRHDCSNHYPKSCEKIKETFESMCKNSVLKK
jgi:hypothetical protein